MGPPFIFAGITTERICKIKWFLVRIVSTVKQQVTSYQFYLNESVTARLANSGAFVSILENWMTVMTVSVRTSRAVWGPSWRTDTLLHVAYTQWCHVVRPTRRDVACLVGRSFSPRTSSSLWMPFIRLCCWCVPLGCYTVQLMVHSWCLSSIRNSPTFIALISPNIRLYLSEAWNRYVHTVIQNL